MRDRVRKSVTRISRRNFDDNDLRRSVTRVSVRNLDRNDLEMRERIRKSVANIVNEDNNFGRRSRVSRISTRISRNNFDVNRERSLERSSNFRNDARRSVRRISTRIVNPRRSISRVYVTQPKVVGVSKSIVFDNNNCYKNSAQPFSNNRSSYLNNGSNSRVLPLAKKHDGVLRNSFAGNLGNSYSRSFMVSKENGNDFRSRVRSSLNGYRTQDNIVESTRFSRFY